MELHVIDPLDVNKHPKIIKDAQSELGKLDILVCGKCHNVFHYIEEFQEHRTSGTCTGISTIRENNINESKAQVWAFLLWKGAQRVDENENSWLVYQRWCKMDSRAKEAWVIAGRNVQVFTKLSAAKMQEVRAKAQTKPKEEDPLEEGEIRRTMKQYKNKSFDSEMDDPLAESDEPPDSESELDTEEEAERQEIERELKNKEAAEAASAVNVKIDKDKEKDNTNEVDDKDKTLAQSVKKLQMNSSITVLPATKKPQGTIMPIEKNTRIAKRTDKNTSTVKDSIVEKILAKRYNPRKKLHEYLLKWDGCPHDQNTWEPAAHMEACKHLLEAFERNLARQKEAKAAVAAAQLNMQKQQQPKPKPSAPGPSGIAVTTPGGRPQRTSKQKALDQVKAWCGNISDRDDEMGEKRKGDSDSEGGPDDKKIKMELGSDSEDEWKASDSDDKHPMISMKPKILQKTGNAVNGVPKKPMTANEIAKSIGLASPDRSNSPPMLLTNNKGVVKVYPRQMSNLSSGVYIMSKKEGIVKLDSTTLPPSNANIVRVQKTGNQLASNVVRVTPKIGQTQVRVIQKTEINSGVVRLSPGMTQTVPPKPRTIIRSALRPQVTKIEKPVVRTTASPIRAGKPVMRTILTPKIQQPLPFEEPGEAPDLKDSDNSEDDDFDPFPKDLPPLEPDSPTREFTLDPETGMIVGQAEGEPEPQPEPIAPVKIKEETDAKETIDEEAINIKKEDKVDEEETNEGAEAQQELKLVISGENSESATESTATISIADNSEPLMITGEDGVVYQVAGQNEEGQTLLVAQSADGQQQCVYVTTTEQSTEEGGTVLTLDTAVAEAMSEGEQLTVQTNFDQENSDSDPNSQVVAQLVKAELPSPGGTRKVVLLLPDGNLLMTEVDAEQFEALELDK